MKRLHSLFTLLLLAVWLPAALHCELVGAGFMTEKTATAPGSESPQACDDGVCHAVEDEIVRPDGSDISLQAPALAWVDLLLRSLATLATQAGGGDVLALDRSAVPPELLPTWQFVRRAAAPPRAPSFLA